jgi:hypothetical protein
VLLLAWFAGAAVLGAGYDVPVIDDWTYAWTVEHMLHTGRFDVLGFSAVYPFSVALWGAAWAWLLGFSFVTLRLSTIVLALVATVTLYLILRELRAPKHLALLGAFVVAANPMFYLLASSFMTDVPFMTCTALAWLCYIRAGSRGDVRLVWLGGLCGILALLIRQLGIITPVAALPLLLRSSRDPIPLPRRPVIAALATTWAVMGGCWWALTATLEPTYVMLELGERLNYVLMVSPTGYLVANLNMLAMMAFHALPALLAMASALALWRSKRLALAIAAAAAVLLLVVGELPHPLKPGNVWSVRELGMPRALVRGQFANDIPLWMIAAMRAVALLAIGIGAAALVRRVQWPRRLPDADGSTPRRRLLDGLETARATVASSGVAPVVTYIGAYAVVANALWFYHDRYLVPVLFVLVVVALGRPVAARRAPVIAWVLVSMFGATAVIGTRDTFRFNEAVRDSTNALVARGVSRRDIDAGYSSNGWTLYAHAPTLDAGHNPGGDVPWISTMETRPYTLATAPMTGYDIEHETTWKDFAWPGPDRLLVLERRPTDATPGRGGGR